jgi:hypothetical protein
VTRNQLEDEIRYVVGRVLTGIPGHAVLSDQQVDSVIGALGLLQVEIAESEYDEQDEAER